MKHPYSGDRVKLLSPCRNCAYLYGLVIIRFKDDAGFIRCGGCDSPLYSVAEQQAREVEA